MSESDVLPASETEVPRSTSTQRRDLAGACLAHMLHDGYTDQLYALLPVWQAEFGLNYAGLAILRALYYGMMGGLQVPGDKFVARVSARTALSLATLIAAAGYFIVALPGGLPVLCTGLVLAGIGSSTQHPRASLLVASAYGKASRGPLGIYNFAGDLGKAIFPVMVALLLPVLAWRSVVAFTAVLGVAVAVILLLLVPRQTVRQSVTAERRSGNARGGKGFWLLLAIGALDTAPRMGYLLFLPFLIQAKGGTESTVGVGLAMLFIGGALGKAVCGWVGEHFGVVASVIATEAATAMLMAATLVLPLEAMFAVLPLLGIVLNGTSSVLYGTVPDLAPRGDTGRAFALFYTGVIVMGGFAPVLYGVLADQTSRTAGILASAATAVVIIPLVIALRPALAEVRQGSSALD